MQARRRGPTVAVEVMNMTSSKLSRLLSLSAIFAVGCLFRISGSGQPRDETRDLPAFDHVEVRAGLEADVAPGPQRVEVRGDDNIVPHVVTTVQNGTLVIEPDADFAASTPLTIEVRAPGLKGVRLRAGGRLSVHDLNAARFELAGASGGDVVASGNVDALTVSLEAGGSIDATAVHAKTATIDARAGGTIDATASDSARGTVISGSEARIHGRPATRAIATKSGGSVVYIED